MEAAGQRWGAGTPDLVLYLQQTLLEKLRANPRYSLRAFAGHLKVDPSLLSKILRGERRISHALFSKLVAMLQLSPEQADSFGRDYGYAVGHGSSEEQYTQITDHFHVIADWYHFAIYELIRTESFQSSAGWVAQALGISLLETRAALNRMARLNIIRKNRQGKWVRSLGSITNSRGNYSVAAMRKFQKQVLEKAIEALENLPVEERDQSSMTMAIDKRMVPAAKKRIAQFRRELSDLLQQTGKLNEVYQLSVSLYPLTHLKRKVPV